VSLVDLARFSGGALRGHRLRTGLSLLGVAIGVAAVVLLTSLGEGARLYVTGEFQALGSNLLIVVPGKTETTGVAPVFGGVPNDLTLSDADAILRQVREVKHLAPLSLGTATARFGPRSRDVTIAGTTAAFRDVRKITMGIGRYLPETEMDRGSRVCVIGSKLQQELFPDRNPLGELLRLGEYRFRIIGVLAPRGESLGMDLDEVIHVPVAVHMKMFNLSSLFRILMEVRAPGEMDPARDAITRLLTERHNDTEDFTLFTQDAILSTFGRIFAALTAAIGGIAAISLSVAGIGIMNVMLVSVSERTAEIGLLKALGVTRGQVLAVFLVEAAILSLLGGVVGLGVALAGNHLLTVLYPSFPVQPPLWAVWAALATAAAVGVVFGALPARRAARMDPVAALAGK
jgi:putative ABC transport system permease protein